VLDDFDGASAALHAAAALEPVDLGARASTRRQLRVVCDARGMSSSIVDVLAMPSVLHYCGHLIRDDANAVNGVGPARRRFPRRTQRRLRLRLTRFWLRHSHRRAPARPRVSSSMPSCRSGSRSSRPYRSRPRARPGRPVFTNASNARHRSPTPPTRRMAETTRCSPTPRVSQWGTRSTAPHTSTPTQNNSRCGTGSPCTAPPVPRETSKPGASRGAPRM